ncbi:MAG: carboxypeptidase-like regulatory domain-containing protein [Bacteroidota bacterium]|nr:MAG: carboxypeptidase-like regulatory domain-containing protein [Bacteroidota bacterium]
MKKLFILSLAVMFSLSLMAGEEVEGSAEGKTTLNGVVVDAENGEALAGVAITANGETRFTDFDGRFTFENVSLGSAIKLEATYVSYNTEVVEIETVNKQVEIALLSK